MNDNEKIKESFCSFEVARLLKDCGFDEECFSYYHTYSCDDFSSEDEYYYESSQYEAVWDGTSFYNHMSTYRIGRCTHQLALAWVRNKGYSIEVHATPVGWTWQVCTNNGKLISFGGASYDYDESIENALKYVLTYILH